MAFSDCRSQKDRDFWKYVEENYREVASWPKWMRGETLASGVRPVAEPEETENEGKHFLLPEQE